MREKKGKKKRMEETRERRDGERDIKGGMERGEEGG